jgi:tripartite-type tricarboxylate transporter receptor subunit TctC
MKTVIAALAAAAACGVATGAAAQSAATYPSKPVRIIVPYTPGGGTDTSARLIGRKLADAWGQQVIVDNRPGASGMIGTEMVAKALPDGHTLLIVVSAHAVNPALYTKIPYNTERDFAAVTIVNESPVVLITHPSIAARNAKELIALAKARPGQLSYGSSEANTHLSGALFGLLAGIQWEHIPYKGGSAVLLDMVGGHLPVGFNSPQTATPHYKARKVNIIGTGGKKRIGSMPEVPIISESGLPGYEANIWYGMFTTAGTPKDVVAKIHQEVAKAIRLPDVLERLTALGTEPVGNAPEAFEAQVRTEMAKWRKVVKDAGIKME